MENTLENFKPDLETLKFVKLIFNIHSDPQSIHNNGYRSLCNIIAKLEKEELEKENSDALRKINTSPK